MRAVDAGPVRQLMDRYDDLRRQLADACLLTLADRFQLDKVFTFDARDFRVARTPGGRSLRILPDDA